MHWSRRCAELFGTAPGSLTDAPAEWLDRVHPDDRAVLSALIAAQLGGAREPLRIEHRVRRDSGGYRWVQCEAVTVPDDAGAPARLLGTLVDVTERKERELALVAGVLREEGTGLPGRASVLDRLGTVLDRARGGEADAALAVLRVVGTEAAGPDATVAAVATRLESTARQGDVVGHLDAQSLAVVALDEPGLPGAARLTEVLDALPVPLRRSLAAGVVPSLRTYADPADAVRAAEAAAAQEVPGVPG